MYFFQLQIEKEFIYQGNDISTKKIPPAPYLKIFTSIPVWSLVVTFIGSGWGYFTLLNEMPTYLNNIQHLNLGAVSFIDNFCGNTGCGVVSSLKWSRNDGEPTKFGHIFTE